MAGVIFNLELSQTISKHGASYAANLLLHDVTPLLFLAFWLLCVPHGLLKFRDVMSWLAFPVLYFGYVLLRGVLIGQYPYRFFNPLLLGYKSVLVNGLEMFAGFLSFGLIILALDRLKQRFTIASE